MEFNTFPGNGLYIKSIHGFSNAITVMIKLIFINGK